MQDILGTSNGDMGVSGVITMCDGGTDVQYISDTYD